MQLKVFNFAIAITILMSHGGIAQTEHHQQHASQIASSDNASILTGASSLYANPAASRHQVQQWDLTSSVSNRFNTDIWSVGAAVSKSFKHAAVGLLVGSYGIEGLKENQISLNFTRAIGADAYLSIQGNYQQLQIEGLGQTGVADITIGYWQVIDNKVIISTYLKNPFQAITDQRRIAGKADIALGYIISDQLQLYASIDKAWDREVSFRPGLVYKPHRILKLYISTDTNPEAISLGVGVDLDNNLKADLGVNTHPILGNSLALSVGYSIE